MDPRDAKTETLIGRRGSRDEEIRLVIFEGAGVRSLPVPGAMSLRVGRSGDVDVALDESSISRLHLILKVGVPGDIPVAEVVDLGSHNGTSLAGRRLPPNEPFPLAPGEMLLVGEHTRVMLLIAKKDASGESPAPRTGGRIVVEDPAMKRVHELLAQVAPSDLSVLLLGESGVGKEILADEVHRLSQRSGPLVRLNCSAIPDDLVESELFGHEKGAFTGAHAAKIGLFEAADGGTVMLDEVGDLPVAAQAKLLRAIEERAVRRVGSIESRPIDVRFVSATNKNLEDGKFRRDLFYRLNGISVVVPPLRERRVEIVPLARGFAAAACEKLKKPTPSLSQETCAVLERHAWPGNIRELKNAIERAVILAGGGALSPEHLGLSSNPNANVNAPPGPASLASGLAPAKELEKQRILAALEQCGGNQTRAAAALGISRKVLLARLDEYGVVRPRKKT